LPVLPHRCRNFCRRWCPETASTACRITFISITPSTLPRLPPQPRHPICALPPMCSIRLGNRRKIKMSAAQRSLITTSTTPLSRTAPFVIDEDAFARFRRCLPVTRSTGAPAPPRTPTARVQQAFARSTPRTAFSAGHEHSACPTSRLPFETINRRAVGGVNRSPWVSLS
jgi:hypothetical protein